MTETKEEKSVYPSWTPRFDWGRWNQRWGTNFPPPPGSSRARAQKKKVEAKATPNKGRKQWEEQNQEACQQLPLIGR